MPLAALALAAALASASTVAEAPLASAGYGQPDVGADNCTVKDPGHAVCFLRPKTIGRYRVRVEGTSTATGANATQSVSIGGPNWGCGQAESKTGSWAGGQRTVTAECAITVLSEEPLEIDATFGGDNVTLDPAGPVVIIQRLPWVGVLNNTNIQPGIKPPPAK